MKTLNTIQALATLAALGSAILVSASPADARGGFSSFGGHASFARPSFAGPSSARPSFAGSSFARPNFGRTGFPGRFPGATGGRQVPPAVLAAQLGNPGHVNPGGTPNIVNTPNGPIFVPPNQPPAVTAAQIGNPGHVNPGGTPNIVNTPNGPIFVPPKQPAPVTPGQPLPPQPH
jgi:hypothetical protein